MSYLELELEELETQLEHLHAKSAHEDVSTQILLTEMAISKVISQLECNETL